MRYKPILYFFLTIVLLTGCHENQKISIDQKILKTDWISSDNKVLFIEDSLLFTNLADHFLPISSYVILDDTLIIQLQSKLKKADTETKSFKIIELDSEKLILKGITDNDTTVLKFKKLALQKNNELSIKSIEFSSSPSLGRSPVIDLKITEDSILYLYGYSYTKHYGLNKHKLSTREFNRIQEKLNTIPLDSFYLEPDCPDATSYSLFIKSDKDSICISGRIQGKVTFNLITFIGYLVSLDYMLDLKKIEETNIQFRNKFNGEWVKDRKEY